MADMLQFFDTEMVSVTRLFYVAGYVNARGQWVAGTEDSDTIQIVIPQPVDGETLKQLPEGEDVSQYLTTFIDSGYGVETRQDKKDPDVIVLSSGNYEVHKCLDYTSYGSFCEYLLKKM